MAIQQHTFLLLILLLLGAGPAASHTSSVIKSTCAAAAKSIWKTDYHDCIRILSNDPKAASAVDARGVAVAAANLTTWNVTSTVRVISDLIDSLNLCLNLYREMDVSVTGAISNFLAGRYDTAWAQLSDASYNPGYCELALMEGNLTPKDPLTQENNASMWLSAMAADIAQAIHDHRTTLP